MFALQPISDFIEAFLDNADNDYAFPSVVPLVHVKSVERALLLEKLRGFPPEGAIAIS
jgi:hypothetical protein